MKLPSLRLLFASGTLAASLLFAGCGGGGHKAAVVSVAQTSLSAGVVGTPYSQTLTTLGGTAPFTWAVTAGTLPTGLALSSSTGVLSGTPTVVGTFTFSITVTDSGKPAQSATANYTLTIAAPGTIAITTLTLPSGTQGVAYSQTLTASGGAAPYTWAVTTGALPAGLTLSSAGVLSGTPTASGTYSFSITATDSSSPALTATSPYTLTIAAPTLMVSTPTLPAGTVGVVYSQTLTATGGTPPYTWTLASGTLPAGLTLSPAGVLSGTPTAVGTSTFAFTVTDMGTPVQTATTGTLTLTIAPAPLAGNSLLQGQYFFKSDLFADDASDTPAHVFHEVYVGSLTFDGAGNITAGESDYADDDYDVINEAVTGTYSIGNDGRGILTLNLATAGTQVFALAVGATTPGGVATRARLVETDAAADYENVGTDYSSGFLQLQDTTAFTPASLTGTSVFGWAGDTYDYFNVSPTLPQQGGLALVGALVVGSDLTLSAGSTADIATNQTTDLNVPLTGLVAPDAGPSGLSTNFQVYGRAMLTLTSTTYPNGKLSAMSVIYVIDANTSYVISYPLGQYEPLYSGYLLRQQLGSFDATSLNGASIAHGASVALNTQPTYADTDTVALYGTSEAYLARYSADGTGNLTTVTDANVSGTITPAAPNSFTYTVAPSGRATFSGAASPILWLSNVNSGFAITQPPASQPTLLTLDPQASASYSTASLNGYLMLGVQDLAGFYSTLFSGEALADGAGNFTGTLDFFTDNGAQGFGASALNNIATISIDGTGRAVITGNYNVGGTIVPPQENAVFYLLSPTNAVGINLSIPGTPDFSPAILTLEPGITPTTSGCAVARPQTGSVKIHPDC